MSRRNSKKGCLAVIVLLIIIGVVAGIAGYTYKEYRSKQEIIVSAIAELPVFDEVAEGKEIARAKGYKFPVPAPTMTPTEIKTQSKNEATLLTKNKYPSSTFTKGQGDIFKKYRPAKEGEEVSFMLKTTGKTIKGAYKGLSSDHKGRFIKVDFKEYRVPDIMKDFHYLFIKGVADLKAREKIKEFEVDFKKNKSEYFKTQNGLILEKLYKQSGFTNVDGTWVPNEEIFATKLKETEDSFLEKLEKEKEDIYQKNKLFGMLKVDINEETEDINDEVKK